MTTRELLQMALEREARLMARIAELECAFNVADEKWVEVGDKLEACEKDQNEYRLAYIRTQNDLIASQQRIEELESTIKSNAIPVKTFSGGVAHYCTGAEETPPCNPDPRAPHGFCRDASHSAGRYVCECEGWYELSDDDKGDACMGAIK